MKKITLILCSIILLSLAVCTNASAYIGKTQWVGSVSFPITVTTMAYDKHGNIVYQKLHLTFTGTVTLFTQKGGGPDPSRIYDITFISDDNKTQIAFFSGNALGVPGYQITTIWTDHGDNSPASESCRLIGWGWFWATTLNANGMAYIDISTVTLHEDRSDNVTYIGVKGKITGGIPALTDGNGHTTQNGFIFDANFSTTLY